MGAQPDSLANPGLERNIRKLYLLCWFSDAQFHLVIYTLYLLAKGFTVRQFFLIESACALVALLMEVPTGVLSDRIGRKWSLIVASLIALPVVPVVILSDSFAVILIAMSISGLSSAFVSGTDTAILYDSLKGIDREEEFVQVLGRTGWYRSLAMSISGGIGGLLAQWDMAYAWWATFLAWVGALAVKCTLQEPPLYTSEKDESYLQHLGRSLRLSFTGDAAYYVLYAAVIWLFFGTGFRLWQPYLQSTGLPVAAFGLLYAALYLVGGYASRQAHRIEGRIGQRKALLALPLMLVVALLLESRYPVLWGFVFLFIHSAAGGSFDPLLEGYINARIPSARRATVLSIKKMLNRVLFVTLSPLVGHVVDLYSLSTALLAMGVVLAVAAFVFYAAYRTGSNNRIGV